MKVTEAVLTRRSVRRFQDRPVPLETLQRVMEAARWAPSGCNFQPWQASILSGEPLRELQELMLASEPQDPPEYNWSAPEAIPECLASLRQVGASMYSAMNIGREDQDMRAEFARNNVVSFGAPAVLFCYMPRLMEAPQWSDVGMWLQTIMLLLREEGLDSCPQEFMAMYARLIKNYLNVSDESHIFFCGLAIGYRDAEAPVNQFARQRFELDQNVRFMGF
ncbi:MAG: hypothetical protein RLZZ136_1092 [Pseudomonadota bacterium]|jgi:nitroreductase